MHGNVFVAIFQQIANNILRHRSNFRCISGAIFRLRSTARKNIGLAKCTSLERFTHLASFGCDSNFS